MRISTHDLQHKLPLPSNTSGCHFFFFQAEDGIRDLIVTGVQTCALPISPGNKLSPAPRGIGAGLRPAISLRGRDLVTRREARSEERRVGKECRSRWSPYH